MADTEADGASTPKLQELGVEKMEERTFGGMKDAVQDVSIILVVPSGGTKVKKLACIRLHSNVLSNRSKYFSTCLSERWNGPGAPCKSSPMEFVLEAQTGVESYFDCFSRMYSPFKIFESVEQALELLKVASQIDFEDLMERISIYLSCKRWSEEDEMRVREYAASPDFPRTHLKDLVAHMGMNASEEQLCNKIRECIEVVFEACCEKEVRFPQFLKGIGRGPSSQFSRLVISAVNSEAKKIFANIANEWNGKIPVNDRDKNTRYRLRTMIWILEELLNEGVAEELVQGIVHLNAIPKYAYEVHEQCLNLGLTGLDLPEVVLRIYKEAAAGHLLLKSSERVALLTNWHYKPIPVCAKFEEAAVELFRTLSLEEQVNLVKSTGERVRAYMNKVSLVTLVSKLHIEFT